MVYKLNSRYQDLLKIRNEARLAGSKYYFTGIMCKRGHLANRYTKSGTCVDCIARSEHRKKIRFQNRNITEQSYEAILNYQGGECAICEDKLGIGNDQAIDHNHKTGEIRGILCKHCNMGLGNFKDNTENLKSAIKYLETVNYRLKMAIFESN